MSGTRKTPRKYTLNVTITEKAGGYDFKVAESKTNKDALIDSATDTFLSLLSKAMVKLADDYCTKHSELNRLEFYNDLVEELSNKLDYNYRSAVTRDTVEWLKQNQPQVYKLNIKDFTKFLEDIE